MGNFKPNEIDPLETSLTVLVAVLFERKEPMYTMAEIMEDGDNMLILFMHILSLTARWDADVTLEAGINLCGRACRNPACLH